MALTDKQEKFVQGLIAGKSQREAYRSAYPKSVNWKDSAVDTQASILFKNSKVLESYNELHDRLIKEAEDDAIIDGKAVLKALMTIAVADVTDYVNVVTKPGKRRLYDADADEYLYIDTEKLYQFVEVVDTDTLPKSKTAVIKSIKQGKHGIEIELCSKEHALELLGKHLGLFKDKVELSGEVNNPFAGLTTEELKKLIFDD